VKDWKTLDEYSASLHSYITFSINGTPHSERLPPKERWSWRKYDSTKLTRFIDSASFEMGEDTLPATGRLDKYLKDACDSCMPKGTYRRGKKPAYWWTQDIARLREAYNKARRRY